MLLKDVLILKLDDVPDSVGEVFEADGLELEAKEVPVTLGFGTSILDHLGYAKLRKVDGEVRADITFYDGLPLHKLDALMRTTPAIGGVALKRRDWVIEKALVNRVGLSIGPNADHRIGSLRQQGYSVEATVSPKLLDAKFESDVHRGRVPAPPMVFVVTKQRSIVPDGKTLTLEDIEEAYENCRASDQVFSLKQERPGLLARAWNWLRETWAIIAMYGSDGGI